EKPEVIDCLMSQIPSSNLMDRPGEIREPKIPPARDLAGANGVDLRLLEEWNQTEKEYPHCSGLQEIFELEAEKTPDAVAVEFPHGDNFRQLTYAQLNARANQLARHLQKLGVGPDVIVGVCAERSIEMTLAVLGIVKAGGA